MDTPLLQLTKLDCARRQLETAVKLYFHFSDPVSIHTLASAAYGLLHNINAHRGGKPMMKDVDLIIEEYKDMVRKKFNEHQNFFKHADKDPSGYTEFNPIVTDGFLYEACSKYFELTGERLSYLEAFTRWFQLWHQDLFESSDPQRAAMVREMKKHYTIQMRPQYFEACMTLVHRAK